MIDKIGKGILVLVLTAAVLLGAYLALGRFMVENSARTVELAVDLNDLKKMAAFDRQPLGRVLGEIRQIGITEIGVFEETLPDANALGELYYAKGSGLLRFKKLSPSLAVLSQKGKIKPDRTYIYVPEEQVRKRVFAHLKSALGEKAVRFLGKEVMEVDELEEDLRTLGLGLSESQAKYLAKQGLTIVPRVWNDPRYNLGNIEQKIEALRGHRLVIFDGDEVLGYPDALPALASALKKYKISYGYVEIVKQGGDLDLKKRMGDNVVRVHSVPKDELKKIDKAEALDRFVRAVRERDVQLVYIRPFLPPQIDAFPVEYNIKYLRELKAKLAAAKFSLGPAAKTPHLRPKGWEIFLLGCGVLCGALFLLDAFTPLPTWLLALLFVAGAGAIFSVGSLGKTLLLQKYLAFTAALVFPSYAVVSSLARPKKGAVLLFWDAALLLLNVVVETSVGIFLMLGLLADSRFMTGVEVFPAVKLALSLPVLIVAAYFLLSAVRGSWWERVKSLLGTRISLLAAGLGLILLGALAVLVARSGNFILPVPGAEKYFRNWLEIVLFVRPRTKEFLVGYPALYLAALYYLRGNRSWLWLLAAIGVIAPVSVFNSFSHIHTPLLISLTRTLNGLALGLVISIIVGLIARRYISAGEK